MSKFTFIYENTDMFNDNAISKLTMESNVVSLDDVLEQFEMFLKGAGFEISGKLDIVYNDGYHYEDDGSEDDYSGVWPFETKASEK